MREWGYLNSPYDLTWDNANAQTKDDRRRTAFCGRNNRCNAANLRRPGYNCDEFPFASTSEADTGGQVSRCVPSIQNDITRKVYLSDLALLFFLSFIAAEATKNRPSD